MLLQARTKRAWARFPAALALAAALGLSSTVSSQDVGTKGPALTGCGPSIGVIAPTGAKPENKLWFHDGSWWGSLWSAGSLAFHIQRLDSATSTWVDTGVAIEGRPDSHADVLADGNQLYVVTHEFSGAGGGPNRPLLFLRYSYAGGAYALDAGYPIAIADSSTEAATIEKDSTGTLWVVWNRDLRVWVTHTLGDDATWTTPAILPPNTSDVTSDDLCSIVRFDGKIGVLWADQVVFNYLFSYHVDGAADTSWSPVEVALNEGDDHINLAADSTGRVYATVKNRADQIKLLVRGSGGGWSQYLVGEAVDVLNRPIVLLDEVERVIHVFASITGAIVEKTSSMDAIAFAPGEGTVVLKDGSLATIHNVTSTRQNVTPTTGLVVLASNEAKEGTYWHHEVPAVPAGSGLVLGAPEPGLAGTFNLLTVTGCTPGATIGFFTGMKLGTSLILRPQCPAGVPIELAQPYKKVGTARANRAGVATLSVFAPAATLGKTFYFQAVEPVSCRATNRVTDLME